MFGTILFRMILWEITKVFVMALIGVTGILMLGGIIAEASQQGLGPGQIFAAIPLIIPSLMPYTIPATTLFAACVCYGRLSADNEIIAIKSAGINISKVVMPGLILGLTMSALTMGLYYRIIPYTHRLLRAMVFRDAQELVYTLLSRQNCIQHPALPYSMFVKSVQGHKLISPTFYHQDAAGDVDVAATARDAEIEVNMDKKQMVLVMRDGKATARDSSQTEFHEQRFEVPLPPNFGADTQRKPRDMTWQEIWEQKAAYRQDLEKIQAEIAQRTSELLLQGALSNLPTHLKQLKMQAKYVAQQNHQLDVELLMRPALSLGCFFFVLVGCPVGIWFSKSDYLSSFITCFLPIVFVYYPLTLCGTGFAKDGKFNDVLLVWGPNLLLGVVGVVLFWRLAKR